MSSASCDAELISAVREGDPAAYGILYERHGEAATRLARHLIAGPDVDDVVAETFTRVLGAIRNGNGPAEAFRPYLLTAVRRVAFDQLRRRREQIPTDEAELPDPGEPFVDPALASLERSLVTRAFRSLPERWSAVLWHTEIERAKPAEVALLLGMTPNGVAALSHRAREGLKQAYLQLHLSARARAECQPVARKLGAHVRGALSARDTRRVDSHLATCGDCQAAHAELATINGALRGLLVPAFLGGTAAAGPWPGPAGIPHAAPASAAQAGAAATAGTAAAQGHQAAWLARLARHHRIASLAASAAAAAVLLPAVIVPHLHQAPPQTPAPGVRPVRSHVGPADRAGTAPRPGTTAPVNRPARSPRPQRSVTGTTPTPVSSSSPAPSPSASGSSPGSHPPVSLTARLGVQVSVAGLLSLGVVAVVTVRVSNQGTAATSGLTASLSLPAGTIVLGLGAGSAGWSCASSSGTTTCTHAGLGAGASVKAAFRVLVVSLAGCGDPVLATVTSGRLSATGQSAATERCGLL